MGLARARRWLACMPMFHIGGLSILVRCALAGAERTASRPLRSRARWQRCSRAAARARVAGADDARARARRMGRAACAARAALRAAGRSRRARRADRARGRARLPDRTHLRSHRGRSQVATRDPRERRAPFADRLRALPGTSLRIVGERGETVPCGGDGEICVRGPTLMTRYVGAPDETRHALRGGWLHTGDYGRLDEEGSLAVLDRRTELIVSGGENIYPAEIESALCEHPAVQEAGVIGRPDAAFGARPVAWVALRPARTERGRAARALHRAPRALQATRRVPLLGAAATQRRREALAPRAARARAAPRGRA